MHNSTSSAGWRNVLILAALAFVFNGVARASSDSTTASSSSSSSQTQTGKPTATNSKSATAHNATSKSTSHKSTSQKASSSHRKKSSKNARSSKKRGQQVIDPTRAREIQAALIREHYLQGEPSGSWDSATQSAMERYQSDQGWQSKTTPDSRALIKLGLGPSHDHLLNPESAMTSTDPKSTPRSAPPSASSSNPTTSDRPQQH